MRYFCLSLLISILSFSGAAFAATYDKPYVGEMKEISAKYEDTFVHLSRDYNLGYIEMRAANPYVDPWVPGANRKLILPTRHLLPDAPRKGVIINLPEMRLYYFPKNGDAPITHPIGVGREGLDTPTGVTKITRKKDGPTWRPTPRMRKEDPTLPVSVPPGPENPLGTHALYLGWPQFLIHGTNKPYGIGRRISSGCIRMYPEDITTVFGQVPVGTAVQVVDQPLKFAWIDNRLYLEANATLQQSIQMEERGEVTRSEMTQVEEDLVTKYAGEWADKIRWAAVRTAIRERNGYPVEIARRSLSIVPDQVDDEIFEKQELIEPQSGDDSAASFVDQSSENEEGEKIVVDVLEAADSEGAPIILNEKTFPYNQ